MEPIKLEAKDSNDFEMLLSPNGRLLFTTNQPIDETVSNLQTVLNKNNPDGVSVDLKSIDYVDLRFGNKIFYKTKTDQKVATTSATSTN